MARIPATMSWSEALRVTRSDVGRLFYEAPRRELAGRRAKGPSGGTCMRALRTTLFAAALVLAATAMAQQDQQPGRRQPGQTVPGQREQQAQRSYEATKAFAVVNTEMQNARVSAKMLQQLSSDQRSYDRQHGEWFVKNIRESLNQAQSYLNKVRPLATSEDERRQFSEASTAIRNALQMLQPMQQQLNDPQPVNQAASRREQQIEQGLEPLRAPASPGKSHTESG